MPPPKLKKVSPLKPAAPVVAAASSPSKNAAMIAKLTAELSGMAGFESASIVMASSPTVKLRGVVPTGSATLDAAIGRGGYPFGRITVIAGGESTGKTTHALHAIKHVQAMGGVGLYIDLENKLDLDYAREGIGVDLDAMTVVRPGYAERAFDISHKFVERISAASDIPVVVVLDSINAAIPKSEFEAEDYDGNAGGMGSQARVFSGAVSRLVQLLGPRRIAYIAISQPRDKIGQAGSWKEKVSGGSTWKFYAALVIDLKKDKDKKVLGADGREGGHGIEATIIKNQVSKPFKVAKYGIVWGSGIDLETALMDQASKQGLMNTGGAAGWCDMPDPAPLVHGEDKEGKPCVGDADCTCDATAKTLKWQGINGFRKLVAERPDVLDYIETGVRSKFK